MENHERTMELIEVATNSTGRANEQFAKYTDTIEYKVNKIKNSWEELRVTLMNKSFFGNILDDIDKALNKMKSMDIKDFAVLTTWAVTVGKNLVTGLIQGISQSGNKLRGLITEKMTGLKPSIDVRAARAEAIKNAEIYRRELQAISQQYMPNTRANLTRAQNNWFGAIDQMSENSSDRVVAEQINSLIIERNKLQREYNTLISQGNQESAQGELTQQRINGVMSQLNLRVSQLSEEHQQVAVALIQENGQLQNTTQQQTLLNAGVEREVALRKQAEKAIWVNAAATAAGQAATTALSMTLTGSFTATEVAASTMTTSLIGAVGALAQGNWQLAIAQAAIGAISWGIKQWFEYVDKLKETEKIANDELYRRRKQLEDLEKIQEDYNKKLDEANTKYNEAKKKWDDINEAAEKYQELNEKSLLDDEETEQLLEATSSLAELIPELVIGYNSEGQAILDTTENYNALIEKYKDAQLEAKALQKQAEATAEALGLVQLYIEGQEKEAQLKSYKEVAKEFDTKEWFVVDGIDWYETTEEVFASSIYNWSDEHYWTEGRDTTPEAWLEEIWKDTSETGSAWRQLIIDTLKETSGAKNTSSLSYNASIKDIESAFDGNDAIWNEFKVKFRENINTIDEEIEKLENESEAKIAELKANIPSLRSSIIDGIITTLDKEGMDETSLAQYKDFLNNQLSNDKLTTFIKDEIAKGASTNGEVIEEGIKAYQKQYAEDSQSLKVFKKLNEDQLELLSNFTEEIVTTNGVGRDLAYSKLIQELGVDRDSEIGQYLYDKIVRTQESLSESAQKAADLLKSQGLSDNYQEIYNSFSEIGEETTNAIIKAISEKSDDAETRALLTNSIVQLFRKGIDPHAISSAINAVDWSSITIFDEKDILKILESSLGDFDLSSSEIQQIYDILAKPFTDKEITSDIVLSSANNLIETYQKFAKGADLAEYFESGKEAIALQGKELKQVQKALSEIGAAADEFLDTTAQGTTLNIAKLREWLEIQTDNTEAYEKELQVLLSKEGELTDEEKQKVENLQDVIKELRQEESIARSILGIEQDINTEITKQAGKISATISSYKTMVSNLYSKGTIDSSSFSSFAESMFALDPSVNLSNFFNNGSFNTQAYQTYINQKIADIEATHDLTQADQEALLTYKKLNWELQEANSELAEQANNDSEVVKAQKEVADAHKAVQKALEDIAEAEQNVIDKQNELNRVMYGSDNFKNSLDSMYNYSTLNQKYADAMQRAKDILDNPNIGDDTKAALQAYMEGSRSQILNYFGQNKIYEAAAQANLNSLYESLPQKLQELNNKFGTNYDTNIQQYFKTIDGVLTADIQALNQAALPDDIKNEIAALAESYNTNSSNILKNNEAIRKLLKERQEIHKANLQAEVAIQEKVADVLKEKYEEQVDDLKDKYDAMKEADDEYLDALQESIDKQRKLRDQENKYEDLAQKRKKLSLQQRDTSGANAVANQKLQREIEKDEQSLLDNAVDDIVNNLKELYELQSETRQDELEYQEALVENTNWIAEANRIVLGLGTAEDFINWMKDNSDDWKDKTAEQIELEEMELTEMFQKHQEYMEEQEQQILNGLDITEAEIQRVVVDTSEALISESERSLNEVTIKVDEAITAAQESLQSALTTLAEKQEAYVTALENEQKAVGNLEIAYNRIEEDAKQLIEMLEGIELQRQQEEAREAEIEAINNAQAEAEKEASLRTAGILNVSGANNTTISQSTAEAQGSVRTAEVLSHKGQQEVQSKAEMKAAYEGSEKRQKYEELLSLLSQEGNPTITSDQEPLSYFYRTTGGLVDGLKAQLFEDGVDVEIGDINGKKVWKGIRYYWQDGKFTPYKTGGLVDYTGPAWVDGTPTRPEAFLSADDTENIAAMTNILASLKDLFDFTTYTTSPTINNTNRNDTTINVTVNVDGISSDYDIDQAVERIKQDIVDAASYSGSNVILNI